MKSIVYVFLIIILLFYPLTSIKADDVSPVDQKIEELKTKISELQNQENSLSKQISLLNSNIELTTLRIDTIKLAIGKLSKEIDELAEEIGRLEVLLTKRLELMLHRIPETYKRQVTPAFGILLFSSDVSDFISRMKYLNRVQEEDAQLLLQLKATQNNFGERKETREKKKTQQETLKKQQEEEQ
ncbi:MAG: Peptidase M23B [Candidatus Gottesmanbacteria bacterium GW2011_GWA1_44_24b]|nr:MAG: Peptidase M23B [Candidatus Gottesmanbacteria bacterium GW2011_GWA1_44_24b]